MTWKKAQNPKDEVSSSKIDEMGKDSKLVAKREFEIFPNIQRFGLCKCCYRRSTKRLSFHPEQSDLAKTGPYGFVITNAEKSRSSNPPNSLEFVEFLSPGQIPPPSVANKHFSLSPILQFCQSTNLRGFSPMVQYSGSVHLEINKSTAKKSSFGIFSVSPIYPILSIYDSIQFFSYGTIFRICTFGNHQIYGQIKSASLKIYKRYICEVNKSM